MKTRKFEYRLSGLPALLGIAFLGMVILGIVAVVVMLGAAMAVAGLAISTVAGLYYVVKRKLGSGHAPVDWKVEHGATRGSSSSEVRVIEAEIVRQS